MVQRSQEARINRDEHPSTDFPLGDYLGLKVGPTDKGSAAGEMKIDLHHLNPHGYVHGGVIFTLLDTVMGAAGMSLVGSDERVATADLHIRYHSGVRSGVLRARAQTLHRSSSTVTLLGEVSLADGTRVASATSSFRVLTTAARD